jgi:hypothetical protein
MKGQAQPAATPPDRGGLRPWHLLLLGVLAAATASIFVTRGSGVVNMVAVAAAVATCGLAAAGLFRTLVPLTSAEAGEQTEMMAGRTRAALEREKMLVLRSIKEVEFDRAMRKISDADYQEMVVRLRARATGLIRQLDGNSGYRSLIERDLQALIGVSARREEGPAPAAPTPGTCAACGVRNDPDARFCKACGAAMGAAS